VEFQKQPRKGFRIKQMIYKKGNEEVVLYHGMTHTDIVRSRFSGVKWLFDLAFTYMTPRPIEKSLRLAVVRNRSFLDFALRQKKPDGTVSEVASTSLIGTTEQTIRKVIHLSAMRGNPERTYPVTAVGPTFPGTFQEYTASIIAQWQSERDRASLNKLSSDLERIGLTSKISARHVNDTQVELQVGRLIQSSRVSSKDMVSIADVGFGVSQTLPVLVALIAADPGQLVYIEEPETHLHPRAQSALAQVLADAAKRGVRVVIETHSQLLLLGIQTLVAEGTLSPELVKLHWFTRRKDGGTEIISADLNEAGAFGDWPEDFAEVALEAESRYLDAAESQQRVH
jgi:hypothetical protein